MIMSEYVSLGKRVSVSAIRDYLFVKKIDKGDSLILNIADYEHVLEEIKKSGEPVDIPLNIFGVLIVKDRNGDVPIGKVQIVEDDKM